MHLKIWTKHCCVKTRLSPCWDKLSVLISTVTGQALLFQCRNFPSQEQTASSVEFRAGICVSGVCASLLEPAARLCGFRCLPPTVQRHTDRENARESARMRLRERTEARLRSEQSHVILFVSLAMVYETSRGQDLLNYEKMRSKGGKVAKRRKKGRINKELKVTTDDEIRFSFHFSFHTIWWQWWRGLSSQSNDEQLLSYYTNDSCLWLLIIWGIRETLVRIVEDEVLCRQSEPQLKFPSWFHPCRKHTSCISSITTSANLASLPVVNYAVTNNRRQHFWMTLSCD